MKKTTIIGIVMLCAIVNLAIAAPRSEDFSNLTGKLKDQTVKHKIRMSKSKSGFVRFIGAPPSSSFKTTTIHDKKSDVLAQSFLKENAAVFGLQNPKVSLKTKRVNSDAKYTFVRFQQAYTGIPVWGAEINVQIEGSDGIVCVLSDIMTDTDAIDKGKLITQPKVTAAEASDAAIDFLSTQFQGIELRATDPNLMIYEPVVVGNSGFTQLVWKINVTSTDTPLVNELVLVNAHTGDIALHFSEIFDARNRQINDSQNTSADPGNLARSEGQGACGIADADSAYDYFGDSYNFYQAHHGRDSINGSGLAISASVRFRSQDSRFWNNAWWDGNRNRFYFDAGWPASDDIVAHEYTHGVTQYNGNGGLIYLNESGAINESFSDIWGEFVDLENGRGTDTPVVRWLVGEDLLEGAIRDMADPPQFSTWYGGAMPDRYNSPDFYNGSEDNGGVHHNSSVGNKLCYLLTDGDTFNAHTVVGLGISKVAGLFYEVQTNLITSGADYQDLYNALTQAAINLGFTSAEKQVLEEACLGVEIKPANAAPILSNPRVAPVSGTVATNFEFLVDYYDADGDPPDAYYRKVHIGSGREGIMTLKSGSASNGTYHYTTTLPIGSYSYLFFFADDRGLGVITNGQSGPYVYSDGNALIDIVIQCTRISSDLRLKYSLTGLGGPWTDIPITKVILDPLAVPAGSTVWFSADTASPNYEYREWELKENGVRIGGSTSSGWQFTLGTNTTEVGLNVFYHYTPQYYTISGTVLKGDNSTVPGGVNLTLTSDVQALSQHSDNGNFSFTGVQGGVSVTITPSASGYEFSPASLVYNNIKDNYSNQTFTAEASDDLAPTTSFVTVPSAVSESSAISFTWTGTDNVVPINLQYQCKLDGVDADWSAWSSGTSKSYDVSNGAYTFWVRAKDEAGNINQAPLSYKFVVNAAPKVIAAERIKNSVWASRVTLQMPQGATHPTNTFVLLPQHSGINDSEIVPVRIHYSDDVNACGANAIVSGQLGLTTRITQAGNGWIVTLPQNIPSGQTAKYDIVWGKIKYFGWKESISIPSGFPSGGSAYNAYLDDALRVWRSASRRVDRAGGLTCGFDAWMCMDICNQSGIVTDETTLRFVRGQCSSGDIGTSTQFNPFSVFKAGDNIYYLWKDYRYEYDGSTDYRYGRYGLQIFDDTGNTVNSADGTYYDKASFILPSGLIHGGIWITARQDIGSHYYDPDEAWFLVLSQNGNEIISKTVFDTIQNPNGSCIDVFGAYPLGNNIVFLWTRQWDTANGRMRQEIAYQVRNINGQLVKSTTVLSPPLLPDSTIANDLYYMERVLQDKNGKLWVTIKRDISGPDEYYYVILGTDGNVWKGPVQTSYLRCFEYCDKDGYIWANENGQFLALNPDDTIAVSPRTGAWNPNQTMGLIAASVGTSGYRLYDRWSPQTIGIDVPAGVSADLMQLFDLNLWGNNLHPADVNITKGATSIWSQSGQFTGHTTVNMSGVLNEGQNLLTITQGDFIGGQVIVTFPYALPPSPDINRDSKVDFGDFATLAEKWKTPCTIPTPCEGADINYSGSVGIDDLVIMAENWVARAVPDPQGIVFVTIDDPGVSGHEGFSGEMSKYETTNTQYCMFLNSAAAKGMLTVQDGRVYAATDSKLYCVTNAADPSSQIAYNDGVFTVRSHDGQSMANHPVVGVSWYGATAFCDYYGYRLPTNWEWRAVADFDGSYIYGCGPTIDGTKANYAYGNPLALSTYPYTTPVDYFPPYGYGMHDMAGNVREWTSSRYTRGGSWFDTDANCTTAAGGVNYSDDTNHGFGFRVCR